MSAIYLSDKQQPNEIDLAINDLKNADTESITPENFKKQLKDLY